MTTATRGRLRIYLGAAPGVGKTCAALDRGRDLRAQGIDVIVGIVDAHERAPTTAMAGDLEMVARRMVSYRGTTFAELDLDAVLARHPRVAVVDELAHTNAPGCRHAKRWQDVNELLAAGIDVITTLNVQHLASLNDTVQQILGVRQRETVPDQVARRADAVVLVDLSPAALRRRVAHGNVYPADRAESALTGYFQVAHLTTLRELAALWIAGLGDGGLRRFRAAHGIASVPRPAETVMVGLTGDAGGEATIRRAAAIVARSPGGDLIAVHVLADDGLTRARPAGLAGQRALVESLGGSYQEVAAGRVAPALLRLAGSRRATHLVLGASRWSRLTNRLAGEDVVASAMRSRGSLDVRIVGREAAAGAPPSAVLPDLAEAAGQRRYRHATVLAALLTPALTAVVPGMGGGDVSDAVLVWLPYLLAILAVAFVCGRRPGSRATFTAA